MDGLNPHCGILDEVHAHPDRTIYDVLKSGMGARRQPMIWMITTAGFDLSSFGYEMHDYAKRVLEGTAQDDGFLGVIYTVDDAEHWDDPQEWAKANPNLGISVYHENLVEVVGRAKQLPSELANVKTKRLNIWLSGEMQWLDMPAWLKSADPGLKREDLVGLPNTLGLDLGDKRDPSTLAHLFWRRESDGRLHWYAFLDTYMPEDEIDQSKNASYRKWVHDGWIQATPGNVTDQDRIEDDIKRLSEHYNPQEIPFDPYQARQLSTHLVDDGVQMVELKPTVLNFSEPMKRLEEAVASGTFHHDGNPVLAWMLSNVVVEEDRKGNIYPRKQLPQNKIDGAVALIMALARALVHVDQGVSVYETWSRS
jgi:phage terminase large subunit-like protein